MYDREQYLKQEFNRTICAILGVAGKDYYSSMPIDQVISLKTALSDINNIITLRLALSLGSWIGSRFMLQPTAASAIINKIKSSKPNANGYDIELNSPDLVAEVKCNLPVNGGMVYGAAQRDGLLKDLNSLLFGKAKSHKNPAGSIKLLGLYDTPAVRSATQHLASNLPTNLKNKVHLDPQPSSKNDRDGVYVIYLKC